MVKADQLLWELDQAQAFFKEISAELQTELTALDKLMSESVTKLNDMVSAAQIEMISSSLN